VKDSSASKEHARILGERFGSELLILNGTDRLLSIALESGAGGSITALANLISPDLRRVWDNFMRGKKDPVGQAKLNNSRRVLEKHLPAAPFLKALLARLHQFPNWTVKPPLCSIKPEAEDRAILDWRTRGKITAAIDSSVKPGMKGE
jgi:dihydrodipicolinate synthase/N-acetylneuraminate lyase